jgi:hypothetical protein
MYQLLNLSQRILFVRLGHDLALAQSMFEKCPAVKTATTSTKSACADSRKIKGLRNLRRQVLYL